MPIVGTTDRQTAITSNRQGMLRIGKIKKGMRDKEKGYPKDLDYFRFVLDAQFDQKIHPKYNITYNQILTDLYGDKPQFIGDLVFFSNDVDTVFDSWYELYGQNNRLKVRCTGETITKHLPRGKYDYSFDEIPCVKDHAEHPCGCRQVGRLSFVLTKFAQKTGIWGYFTLETHAFKELSKFSETLYAIKENFGSIQSMQWVLERVPVKEDFKKRNDKGEAIGLSSATRWEVRLRPSEQSVQHMTNLMESEQVQALSLTSGDLDTSHMLPDVQSANVVIESTQPTIQDEPDSSIAITEIVDWIQAYYDVVTITDLADSFKAVGVELDDFNGEVETAFAIFAWHWSGQTQKTAHEIIDTLCEHRDNISSEDAHLILDSIVFDQLDEV